MFGAFWNNNARRAVLIFSLASVVGFLHIAPPLLIAYHRAASGEPFVFGVESYRNDLGYLARAREIYDGRFPPSDLFSDQPRPTIQNPLPSSIMAAFLAVAGGRIVPAYLLALFVFSQLNFLAFYLLGRALFASPAAAILFALIGALTPIPFRIFNFDGTA